MKTSNVNQPGERQQGIVRGHTGRGRAGTPGMTFRTATVEADPIWDLTIVGGTLTDYDDGTALLTISGTSGAGTFNVKDYLATGDDSTDDTAAINAAIGALNSAGCGVLYFPCGTYRVTSALDTITAGCTIVGDGRGAWSATEAPIGDVSVIDFTSATAVLFTITAGWAIFSSLCLRNTAGSTPSAGAAIRASGSDYRQKVDIDNCMIVGFYIGYDCQVNGGFTMDHTDIVNPVLYGVKIQNTVVTDGGGASIANCRIFSDNTPGSFTAGVYIASSGGNKIVATNIGSGVNAIKLATVAPSSILLIEACSFENHTGDAIHLDGSSGAYQFVTVIGCQIAQQGSNSTGYAFYSTGVSSIIVTDNHLINDFSTPATAISLNSGSKAFIGRNQITGWAGYYATSSFTSVSDATGVIGAGVAITGTPSSGQVPVASSGTAAAWGSAAGGITGLAAPAFTLGTSNVAGSATTAPATDATIAAFDATTPAAIGTAATGAAAKAARRDHVHATGASTPTTSAIGDAAATGSGPAAAMTDHVHGREALSTATPLVESGAGAVGTGVKSSREDHVHPAATASVSTAPVIGQEERISDGATVAWALDNDFEDNSVSARNLTTGHNLSVTETLPSTATISAAGTAGDVIAFSYTPQVA